jgi:hypothetical protein
MGIELLCSFGFRVFTRGEHGRGRVRYVPAWGAWPRKRKKWRPQREQR